MLPISTASTDSDERSNPTYMFATDGGAPGIGSAVDWTHTGQVQVFVLGQNPAGGNFAGDPGAQLTLAPAPPTGSGPFFIDDGENIVTGATSFIDNFAWYFNLPAGNYTLTFDDPRNDCEAIAFPFAGWGYAGAMGTHQISFPVVPGYVLGLVGEICTPVSTIVSTDDAGGPSGDDGGNGEAGEGGGSTDSGGGG
jgi:hypothetical protein